MADNDVIYPIDNEYEHIFPINDLYEHELVGPNCLCEPKIKVDGARLIVVHNAFDHREIVEQAIEILNGRDDNDR